MSIRSLFARLTTKVAAVAVFAWAGSPTFAADVVRPPVVTAAPVAVGPAVIGQAPGPGCETCQHGVAKGGCSTCGKSLLFSHKNKGPYQVNLCPGACFGHFQTQWRKWDEVCPYPYLGHGVSDAPRPPIPVVNVPRPGSGELTPPRPLDPKMADPKKPDLGKPGLEKPSTLLPIAPLPRKPNGLPSIPPIPGN